MELLAILALSFGIFFAARKIMRKRGKRRAARAETTHIDSWIASQVAKLVERRLAGTDEPIAAKDIKKALGGDPDPDVVSAVERAVHSVDVVYEKLADGQVDVRVTVAFEGGGDSRASRVLPAAEVPEAIREELANSPASQLHKTWSMSWAD